MIHYFSGTGNSLTAARTLSRLTGLPLQPMTVQEPQAPGSDHAAWGLVFPVYAWGLPAIVETFISHIEVDPKTPPPYTFALLTCGDDVGRSDVLLRQALRRRGLALHAVFSVQMRNTYVCLPGFDVDPAGMALAKEQAAQERLSQIARRILRREPGEAGDVYPGAFPRFKSHVLRRFFKVFLTSDHAFHAATTRCTHCGLCVKICPLGNIALNRQRLPSWHGHCTLCLRCYHGCPAHAIGYGKFTKGKGQVEINPYFCHAKSDRSPE